MLPEEVRESEQTHLDYDNDGEDDEYDNDDCRSGRGEEKSPL